MSYDFSLSYHEPDSWDELPPNYDDDIDTFKGTPKGLVVVMALIFIAMIALVVVLGVDTSGGHPTLANMILFSEIFVVVGVAAMAFGVFLAVSALVKHRKNDKLVKWEGSVLAGFAFFLGGLVCFCLTLGSLPGYIDDLETGPRTVTAQLEGIEHHRSRRGHVSTRFNYVTTGDEHVSFSFGEEHQETIDELKAYRDAVTLTYYPHARVLVECVPVEPVKPVEPPSAEEPAYNLADALQGWFDANIAHGDSSAEDSSSKRATAE